MAKFGRPPHMGDPHGDLQTRPQHADPHRLGALKKPYKKSMWRAGLRFAMWIAHVRVKFRHGLLEKSLNDCISSGPHDMTPLQPLHIPQLLLHIIMTFKLSLK